MACCGGRQFNYTPKFSAVGPVTCIDHCPCKWNPPFGSFCPSAPVFSRPTCYCEDWSTPCITYQSDRHYHYLPSPLSGARGKKLYFMCEPMIPGYSGHIPSLKYHGAARTFGDATRDIATVLGNRGGPCRGLPDRIWEQ